MTQARELPETLFDKLECAINLADACGYRVILEVMREIRDHLTRPTPGLGDVDELVERIRDYIYDCTKDEFGHGWTLSGEQVRHIIALHAALDKNA
jgi:hypothetical protein